jgi:hypothetical protein
MVLMFDAAYQSDIAAKAFAAEMRGKARVRPRRASTKRNAEIDQSSPAGAAELGRRIVQFWAAAGYDITIEVVHSGGRRESPIFGIRSNLIGGLPRPVAPKPGGSPASPAWACRLDRAV